MYNINRRKFLGYFGCSCCSLILPSCTTVPITDRKQLSIVSEARINKQAAAAYEQFRKNDPSFRKFKGCQSEARQTEASQPKPNEPSSSKSYAREPDGS